MVERFCDEALWLDAGRIKGSGDPKRIVGAYITDVERQEEQRAGRDRREGAGSRRRPSSRPTNPRRRSSPTTRSRPRPAPADMFRAAEGRWGSREVEITEVDARRARTAQPGHVFHSGERARRADPPARAAPIDDFVVGVGIFNAEGVCCYGTNTYIEELRRSRLAGDAEAVVRHRRARSGRRHLQARRRRPQDRRLSLRLPPPAAHLPREVPREGRRHLPAAAHLALHRRHARSRRRPTRSAAVNRDPRRRRSRDVRAQRRAPPAVASCSRTACSTSCTRDTCATCRRRARHGDRCLIVGLNSDASVRRNKGPSRPINPEHERAEILAALACVDAVSIFDDETPADIIRRVQPDILVKGADWPADQIVGRDTVEARGGRVILEPVEPGYSTTRIIEKVNRAHGSTPSSQGTKTFRFCHFVPLWPLCEAVGTSRPGLRACDN